MRASIANVAEEQVAEMAHAAGLAGFVMSATGFGRPYPIEKCTVIESASNAEGFLAFVLSVLEVCAEESAYVTYGGAPYLLFRNGRIDPIPSPTESTVTV